jgi:hypothetical protein
MLTLQAASRLPICLNFAPSSAVFYLSEEVARLGFSWVPGRGLLALAKDRLAAFLAGLTPAPSAVFKSVFSVSV